MGDGAASRRRKTVDDRDVQVDHEDTCEHDRAGRISLIPH